ncbi:MAG: hypothetical protein HYV63_24035 [Candidatus Schekmanbacteria bacterium]|nr:hypothetical protein [Candidatus Schekmanbacteria bacterium]
MAVLETHLLHCAQKMWVEQVYSAHLLGRERQVGVREGEDQPSAHERLNEALGLVTAGDSNAAVMQALFSALRRELKGNPPVAHELADLSMVVECVRGEAFYALGTNVVHLSAQIVLTIVRSRDPARLLLRPLIPHVLPVVRTARKVLERVQHMMDFLDQYDERLIQLEISRLDRDIAREQDTAFGKRLVHVRDLRATTLQTLREIGGLLGDHELRMRDIAAALDATYVRVVQVTLQDAAQPAELEKINELLANLSAEIDGASAALAVRDL